MGLVSVTYVRWQRWRSRWRCEIRRAGGRSSRIICWTTISFCQRCAAAASGRSAERQDADARYRDLQGPRADGAGWVGDDPASAARCVEEILASLQVEGGSCMGWSSDCWQLRWFAVSLGAAAHTDCVSSCVDGLLSRTPNYFSRKHSANPRVKPQNHLTP